MPRRHNTSDSAQVQQREAGTDSSRIRRIEQSIAELAASIDAIHDTLEHHRYDAMMAQ